MSHVHGKCWWHEKDRRTDKLNVFTKSEDILNFNKPNEAGETAYLEKL